MERVRVTSSSSSNNDIRKDELEGNDHISNLPLSILLYILSFLPFKDWIAMSLVSRQWKRVWTHIQSLTFDEVQMIKLIMRRYTLCSLCGEVINRNRHQSRHHLIYAARMEFMEHVDLVLQRHSGCTISKFQLSLQDDAPGKYASRIDSWVHFAMTRQVEEFELNLFKGRLLGGPSNYLARLYEFPRGPFAPKILKRLMLNFCKFKVSTFEVFASLHILHLVRVRVMDFSIGDLLSICPVLEELHLKYCVLPQRYLVCKQHMKIKRLSLINCMEKNLLMIPMDITAPDLSVLIIKGKYLTESTVSVKNAVNLVDVKIDISNNVADCVRGNFVGSLLKDLSHCRTLNLTSWCIQVLPTGHNQRNTLPTPLYHLEHLRLKVGLIKQELPGISCLLKSCPNLDCLTLDMIEMTENLNVGWNMVHNAIPEDIYRFPIDMYWELQPLPYECLEKCLKKVTINGFSGRQSETRIMEFLLKNAAVLENLEIHYLGIDTRGQVTDQELQSYVNLVSNSIVHLLVFPRAVTNINISIAKMEMRNGH